MNKKKSKIFKNNLPLLLMCIPAIVLLIIFNYIPMLGICIAFKNINYSKGILGSDWVGFKNFEFFFKSIYAWRITRNTLGMNGIFILSNLFFSICFALMLNEITKRSLVKFFQTTMFFPHFLSWVVAAFMLYSFLNVKLGIVNTYLKNVGIAPVDWYGNPKYWPYILSFMNIWKHAGYYSLIFYAGIMGIDDSYYEAATIDGASKFKQVTNITIPLLVPIIIVVALLQIGKIFYADFGMFYQLPRNIGVLYPTTDVLDTYVFRALRVTGDIGMASAAGFYQSIVGFVLVLITNAAVKKINPENALF